MRISSAQLFTSGFLLLTIGCGPEQGHPGEAIGLASVPTSTGQRPARIQHILDAQSAAASAFSFHEGVAQNTANGFAVSVEGGHLELRGRAGVCEMSTQANDFATENNRAIGRGTGFTETYVNGPLGVEQMFTLERPMDLAMEWRGGHVRELGDGSLSLGCGSARLRFSDAWVEDRLGRAVPVSLRIAGDHTIVIDIDDAQAAYPLFVDPLIWAESFQLTAGDAAASDFFGGYNGVDVSGDRAIVGAYNDDDDGLASGSAYVFELTNNAWSQAVKLTASDAAAGDEFGSAVAISGDRAVVGAAFADSNGADSGAAYAFERNAQGMWTEVQKLAPGGAGDQFGRAVGLDGDRLAITAWFDDDAADDGGAVYVFEHDGTSWVQTQKLTALDAADDDKLGLSVDLHGDRLIAGAIHEDGPVNTDNRGAAYVFERSGTWSEVAKLVASDQAASAFFGYSVAIVGDRAIVGANSADNMFQGSGSAYIFERSGGGVWAEADKVIAADESQNDAFGSSVAIAGDHAAVGAIAQSDIALVSGAVYFFERDTGGVWQDGPIRKSSGASGLGQLGRSMRMDGTRLVVGADGESGHGRAYILDALEDAPDGTLCGDDGQCLSGNCVDGVCCDTACGGGDSGDCQACSIGHGATVDGQCEVLSAGTVCRDAAGSCDAIEVCDGALATCPADAVQPAQSPGVPSCAPYVCHGFADCPNGCSTTAHCVTGLSCLNNVCVDPGGTGGGGGSGGGGGAGGSTTGGGSATGGSATGGGSVGGMGAGASSGSGGATMTSVGGSSGGPAVTSTGSGGANGDEDAVVDEGCGCVVVGKPAPMLSWAWLACLAAVACRRLTGIRITRRGRADRRR